MVNQSSSRSRRHPIRRIGARIYRAICKQRFADQSWCGSRLRGASVLQPLDGRRSSYADWCDVEDSLGCAWMLASFQSSEDEVHEYIGKPEPRRSRKPTMTIVRQLITSAEDQHHSSTNLGDSWSWQKVAGSNTKKNYVRSKLNAELFPCTT